MLDAVQKLSKDDQNLLKAEMNGLDVDEELGELLFNKDEFEDLFNDLAVEVKSLLIDGLKARGIINTP